MRYWLMKSEPSECSVDDVLAMPDQTVAWYGVRNYQARNFMRDQMRPGDQVFFYHSNCSIPGIVGLAEVTCLAYPDQTQFEKDSKYYDPKATPEKPRWMNVDVRILRKIPVIELRTLRNHPKLANMRVLQKGSRLSITPVDPVEWRYICENLAKSGDAA